MASDGAAAATADASGLYALRRPPPAAAAARRPAPPPPAQRSRPLRQAWKLVGGARYAVCLSWMVRPGLCPLPRRWQPSTRLSGRYIRALQGLGGCRRHSAPPPRCPWVSHPSGAAQGSALHAAPAACVARMSGQLVRPLRGV